MFTTKPPMKSALLALLVIALFGITIIGCHSSTESPAASNKTEKPFYLFQPPPEKGGAELWGENCTRCHSAQPPEKYSDAQWDAIVHHMRLRANLTGDESRKIAEFLKASN